MAGDRMQGHRERIGEHRRLVANWPWNRKQHAVVGGHQFGVSAGYVRRHPGMDARLDATVGEAPAQAVVTALAGRARWFDPPWPARQPRVEHHPLTDFEPTRLGPQLHHVGDHLVAHDLRERAEGGQGVVGVLLAEVEQDLLGVRPADARQPRPGDHPIRSQRPWICQLAQRRRGAGQVARQRVRRLIDLEWLGG